MRCLKFAVLTAMLGAAVPVAAQNATPALPVPGAPSALSLLAKGRGAATLDAAEVELQALQERWLELERERTALEKSLRDTLTKYAEGSPQVNDARTKLEEVAKAVTEVKYRMESVLQERNDRINGRGRMLMRPVAVQLQNATVRQAADALSQATKLSIRVIGEVPEGTRLTVQARGVTLGAVLEAIGRQANLKLAPAEDGVVIGPWPMVEVNGQQQVFRGRMAPWSSEWGILPGYASREGWVFPGEAELTDLPLTVVVPAQDPLLVPPGGDPLGQPNERRTVTPLFPGADQVPGSPGFGGGRSTRSLPSTALAISVASLGERMFVVSEPGRGADNQAGAWITIYRLDGTQLKKVTSTFHVLHRTTTGGEPGMPGAAPGGSSLAPLPFGGAPGLEPTPPTPGLFGGGAGGAVPPGLFGGGAPSAPRAGGGIGGGGGAPTPAAGLPPSPATVTVRPQPPAVTVQPQPAAVTVRPQPAAVTVRPQPAKKAPANRR